MLQLAQWIVGAIIVIMLLAFLARLLGFALL